MCIQLQNVYSQGILSLPRFMNFIVLDLYLTPSIHFGCNIAVLTTVIKCLPLTLYLSISLSLALLISEVIGLKINLQIIIPSAFHKDSAIGLQADSNLSKCNRGGIVMTSVFLNAMHIATSLIQSQFRAVHLSFLLLQSVSLPYPFCVH